MNEKTTGAAGGGERTKPFVVGQSYRTKRGDMVLIIARSNVGTNYECVEGGDHVWRYNRASDRGRVTASPFDMSCPLNLVPEKADA